MSSQSLIQLPVFALPKSHLFPGIYLPLHVFEKPYKAMLEFVLQNNSLMAVSYSPEMKSGEFFPSRVCGAGVVNVIQQYEDGASDILVVGTHRVKFKRFVQEVPFLIGEGEFLDTDKSMPEKTQEKLLTELKEMLMGWFFSKFDDSERPIQFIKNVNDLEMITHFAAQYFVTDLEQKQQLLEDDKLESRAQLVWQVLKDITGPDPLQKAPPAELFVFPGQLDTTKKPIQ